MSDGHSPAGLGGGAPNLDQLSEVSSQMGQSQSAGHAAPASPIPGTPPPAQSPPVEPRSVGSLPQELVTRPVQDIFSELFNLRSWLGLPSPNSDPAAKARKQQMLQRFNQMTAEEQQIAQERYQREMQRKQQLAQEAEQRRQQDHQQAGFEMPSSPQKGPVGPSGSRKQRASQQLTQDRKTLSGPASAN